MCFSPLLHVSLSLPMSHCLDSCSYGIRNMVGSLLPFLHLYFKGLSCSTSSSLQDTFQSNSRSRQNRLGIFAGNAYMCSCALIWKEMTSFLCWVFQAMNVGFNSLLAQLTDPGGTFTHGAWSEAERVILPHLSGCLTLTWRFLVCPSLWQKAAS